MSRTRTFMKITLLDLENKFDTTTCLVQYFLFEVFKKIFKTVINIFKFYNSLEPPRKPLKSRSAFVFVFIMVCGYIQQFLTG